MTGELQTVSEVIGEVAGALDQLPAPIKRNLFSAVTSLITGVVNVPASYLEMKAAEFQVRKQGHEEIMAAAVRQAAHLAGHSPDIGNRALEYFANDLVKGQANREAVAREAIQASKTLPPPKLQDEIRPIDEDWLEQFRRLASTKSNAEVQAILGRVLAGEAQKPGSFSPLTLDVIAKLDPNTARLFEKIISFAIIIPGHPDVVFSSIIASDMLALDDIQNYMSMRHLQSYGLLSASLGQGFNPEYFVSLPNSRLGGQLVTFSAAKNVDQATTKFSPPINGEAWPLSLPAVQLEPLISKSFDRLYARRLRDGMKRLGVILTFPNVDIDADQ